MTAWWSLYTCTAHAQLGTACYSGVPKHVVFTIELGRAEGGMPVLCPEGAGPHNIVHRARVYVRARARWNTACGRDRECCLSTVSEQNPVNIMWKSLFWGRNSKPTHLSYKTQNLPSLYNCSRCCLFKRTSMKTLLCVKSVDVKFSFPFSSSASAVTSALHSLPNHSPRPASLDLLSTSNCVLLCTKNTNFENFL